MLERFPAGWTTPIIYALKKSATAGAVPAAFDASGMTLAIVLRDRTGAVFTPAGVAAWHDQATSLAKFTPVVGDLTVERSPIRARWQVTAADGIAFFPKDQPDEWVIDNP